VQISQKAAYYPKEYNYVLEYFGVSHYIYVIGINTNLKVLRLLLVVVSVRVGE
jgi:hypothetical protein